MCLIYNLTLSYSVSLIYFFGLQQLLIFLVLTMQKNYLHVVSIFQQFHVGGMNHCHRHCNKRMLTIMKITFHSRHAWWLPLVDKWFVIDDLVAISIRFFWTWIIVQITFCSRCAWRLPLVDVRFIIDSSVGFAIRFFWTWRDKLSCQAWLRPSNRGRWFHVWRSFIRQAHHYDNQWNL